MSTLSYHQNMSMKKTTFGDWLKRQREVRRLTQKDVERQANLSQNYVSRLESGRITLPVPETRELIHMALGTSEDDLVAVGILERIDSLEPSGQPVYIPVEHIPVIERTRMARETGPHEEAVNAREGLIAHLHTYGLTERQISALLAMLDAFIQE